MSSNRPSFLAFFKKARKRNDKVYFFWTYINSFNLKNEHYNSISRHKTFGGVSFLLFTLFGPFLMKLTITFSAILSLCRFGDHVLLFSGSTAMMLVFQASCSQISCDFFSPHRPTHPKPGNLFDAKRTKRGWPKPYGFFLGFLATLLPLISVYLYFVLFFLFLSVK